MSVLWSVVDENGSHELDDDALLTLEIALQSNAPRVAIDVSDDIGYLLDLDLREMTCLQNPNVHLHRRQSPHLDDKWCIYIEHASEEGSWHELHPSTADLLSIAQDAGFSTMAYECGGHHYQVNLKKMRVRRSDGDGRDEKYILRVQPPLEVQDDDDDSTTPRCPISQLPLVEPVVAADGHTYEKRQLQRWLAKRCTSPMTNESMVPWMARNFALEALLLDNKKRRRPPDAAALDAPTSAEKKKKSVAPPSASSAPGVGGGDDDGVGCE